MHPTLKHALLGEAKDLRKAERLLWNAWKTAKDWNGSPANEILAAIYTTTDRRRGLIIRAWEGRREPKKD